MTKELKEALNRELDAALESGGASHEDVRRDSTGLNTARGLT